MIDAPIEAEMYITAAIFTSSECCEFILSSDYSSNSIGISIHLEQESSSIILILKQMKTWNSAVALMQAAILSSEMFARGHKTANLSLLFYRQLIKFGGNTYLL
jgi:hypothetical protein